MSRRSEEHFREERPPDNGLEAYRRLVELQKQMVALTKTNEQSKQACQSLRQQIEREAEALRGSMLRPQLREWSRVLFRPVAQSKSLLRRALRSLA